MAIIFNETDTPGATVNVACSPNALGAGGASSRAASVQSQYGSHEVTASMGISEANAIYAMFEMLPAAKVTWSSGDCLMNFRVTTPNTNIDWVRTDICHVSATNVSLETLATDKVPVNLGPADKDFILKLIPGLVAAVVPISTGDKVWILLSFTNNAASAQSFGWTPSLDITLPWLDRGFEMTAHMGPHKKKVPRDIFGNPIARPEEEVLLMLGDEEPFG
jgi:hypothetical protein